MADDSKRIDRRKVLQSLGAAGMVGLAGCGGGGGTPTPGGDGGGTGDGGGGDGGTPTDGGSDGGGGDGGTQTGDGGGGGKDQVQAAWLYISEIGDLGWSWAHNQGRLAVEESFDWVKTDYSEAVPPGDSKRVFEQYARNGYDIIFGTTFGYMKPMFEVSKKYPDVKFEHATGYKTRKNMGRYMGKIYEPRYLAGQAAGMVTDVNEIGYVAAFPIPEVIRSINAMALGARSVNPEATFKVRWVNSWFDPPTSKKAANSLIDAGCDVIAQEQDSPAAVKAAADAGVWASGYNAPMKRFAGDNYLISPIWHWENFYKPAVKSVHEGTWKSDSFWGDMGTGVPALDDWGPEVPQKVKDKVASTKKKILNDNFNVWAGSKFEGKSDKFLFQEMNSFVPAVDAEVPK